MREIRCRAWDKENQVMIYDTDSESRFVIEDGKVLVTYFTEKWKEGGGEIYEVPSWENVDCEVMFLTGLKDKNGVEIYEGDWLRGIQKEQKDKDGVHAFPLTDNVSYRNGGFKVFSKCLQDSYTRDNNHLYQFMWCSPGHFNVPDSYYQIDEIEVIGNIYEQPNLLP